MGILTLKGIAASYGIAYGNVRIVKKKIEDIAKFKQGEILVARTTSPFFTPAIQKAAAVVTDIGGRTCHAAIISRELGIPCVVSTLKATRFLKNNQKVKVDGTKGIVYKI